MKLIGLGLLALICYAGSPTRSNQLAPVTLFTQFQQPVEAAVMNALQEEVANILAPAGFHFRWYPLAEAASAGSSVELAVVTFHGSCGVPDGPPYLPTQTQALGFTHITDGEILPFTTVDCERTQSFLAKAVVGLPQSERAEAFGRALGRILAHELYHIFANTQRHARNGVAKEAVTVADLMGENFSLEPREYERLRSSRAYSVLLTAGAL